MIIWIASYPKSGNTWIRSFLSSYLFSNKGEFNFNLLKNIDQFWVRKQIDVNNDKISLQERIAQRWIPNQKLINADKKIHYLKTHSALCTINGNKFTDKYNTRAAIYIVRDPRNITISLSNHYELKHSEATDFITNKRKIIFPKKQNQNNSNYEDFNFLGDWSGHYKSWKNNNFCPIKIIRYEDILGDTKNVFFSILEFLSKYTKIEIIGKKIENSINSTNFEILSKMEDENNFPESSISSKNNKKIKFFNLGKNNDWKKLLDKSLSKKIEESFKNEMIELNYL